MSLLQESWTVNFYCLFSTVTFVTCKSYVYLIQYLPFEINPFECVFRMYGFSPFIYLCTVPENASSDLSVTTTKYSGVLLLLATNLSPPSTQ